ncbi:hypothetical protein WIW50_10525 [Flavobacteriaceae bacterium 3-367]|uniref:hypothetical protein n=1 Tax=Eudoraea algarum TaxID=3417568 RepID=UPI00329433DE
MMTTDRKVLKIPLRLGIAVLILGILIKIQDWSPHANIIMVTALTGIAVMYSIRFLKKTKKRFLDYVKLILVVVWCTNVVFSIFHLPYEGILEIITFITFLIWTVLEGTAYFARNEDDRKISLDQIMWNGIMVIGSLAIIAGVISKILYYDYATPLLLLGFFLIAVYILRDTFSELLEEKK